MAVIQGMIAKLPRTSTAGDLLDREFPPIRWIVPGILTPGLTILAGAPKLGKSWMVLGLARSIASGGFALGRIPIERGEALLLALEDTERRIKDRLVRIGAERTPDLRVATDWPRGREAASYLDAWMLEHPETVAVFVDTLQKVSGVEDTNDYRQTYEAVGQLKQVADRHGIGVMVVHHTHKGAQDGDFVHTVSGSVGFTGAADTIVIMTRPRGQRDGVLRVTGRDVTEADYGVRFDADIGTWTLLDSVPVAPSMRSPAHDFKSAAAGEEGGEV
jgi:nucleotide-binding universal stress UspA family protein